MLGVECALVNEDFEVHLTKGFTRPNMGGT